MDTEIKNVIPFLLLKNGILKNFTNFLSINLRKLVQDLYE